MAVSAAVAVVVAIRHWRDDDLHLAFFCSKKRIEDGTYRYWYVIRIVNAGKNPVRFRSFTLKNGFPSCRMIGIYSYPKNGERLITPGGMIEVDAIVVTEAADVIFPESAEIWCRTASSEEVYVGRVKFSDDCPASKSNELARFADFDMSFMDEFYSAR